jgi:hypothetical protein
MQLWHQRREQVLSSTTLGQLTVSLEGIDAALLPPQVLALIIARLSPCSRWATPATRASDTA